MDLSGELHERAQRRIGQVLGGRYRLDIVLGVGGMGMVFGAMSSEGHAVAVKLLHAELLQVPALAARFVREAYVANHIAHAGVPRVFEHGHDETGAPYIAMELLAGETLEARWEKCGYRLPLGEVLDVADRLLDVLAAAHGKGVIHRDVKPENVFLTSDGELKVLDFGIARLLDGSGATASGEMMGTPAFMPPEQAEGNSRSADERSDIWSVGALMFTMISGRHVHEAKGAPLQLIYAATRRAPSLASVAPGTPPALVAIVDRALAFERRARWPSATEMLTEIRFTTGRTEELPAVKLPALEGPTSTGPTLPMGAMSLPVRSSKNDPK